MSGSLSIGSSLEFAGTSVDNATCDDVGGENSLVDVDDVKHGLSKADASPSSRSRVVVFDIDDTLCKSDFIGIRAGEKALKIAIKNHPECPFIFSDEWEDRSFMRKLHVFLPYLQIVFDYLLQQGVRIVFFSCSMKKRNVSVIPELLISFWGREKFEALKAKGQFEIFSAEHVRPCTTFQDEGTCVKDLKVVIRGDETLSDAILVEGVISFAAYDQKPVLNIIELKEWCLSDNYRHIPLSRAGKSNNFPLNSVYYMFGVFRTYFENEKFKVLPLREGLRQILPEDACSLISFFLKHSFANDMIELGLSEVQKVVPDAIYY
ncbi:uncharacterized protein LOC135836185 [Planococcus citri]|uniref:uncharacterized protein LOC135836185 n=1 Tax=Planococcus citri TaxID=170843 RepID=UPI0031F75302